MLSPDQLGFEWQQDFEIIRFLNGGITWDQLKMLPAYEREMIKSLIIHYKEKMEAEARNVNR